jgi:magnesium-transporting ATPase (P-type)
MPDDLKSNAKLEPSKSSPLKNTDRHLQIGATPDPHYGNNEITTSKYSLWNFLPFNLFYQVTKTANIYFIVITILQTIKPISLTSGVPTMLVTLTFVIVLSMIKDFIENYKLWKRDKKENNSLVEVLNGNQTNKVAKSELKVGSIVRVD